MNDALPPSDENELSAEDLEVLRAFDAMENWNSSLSTSTLPPSPGAQESSTHTKQLALDDIVDEMMMVFVTEADEDISKMRRALNQLEQEEQINPARFVALQRAGHKLRGTSVAVYCHTIATIAHHVEVIAEQVTLGLLFPLIGSNALSQAVSALELLEKNLITYGSEQEGEALLAALATVYQTLNIDLQQPLARPAEQTTSVTHPLEIELVEETSEEAGVSVH